VNRSTSGNAFRDKNEKRHSVNTRADPLKRAKTEGMMNAAAKDFGGQCRGVSWHRLLLTGIVAFSTALSPTVRSEDSALQPLNTFGAVQIPRVELNIARDATAVRTEDVGRKGAFLDL
jgi:hypothetical protein